MFARPRIVPIARLRISPLCRIATIAGVAMILATPLPAQEADVARASHRPRGNAVTHWNTVATDAFTPSQGTNPMVQSRTLAILHAAMHDALNAIDRRFASYTPVLAESPGASVDAAVAAAARDVLVTLLPDQAVLVEAAYERALAAILDGPAKSAGIVTGQASAAANIAGRQGDGFEAATQPVYVPRPGPGEYQFTPPFNFAAQPGWGGVKPFLIDPREHAVDGPQRLASVQYARDLAYVKAIGEITSTIRTPEQSEIAQFWYEDSPLGWNRIANTAIRQRALNPWSAARAFALVNFAMADGFIAGFEAKYRFRFWRPGNGDPRSGHGWQPTDGAGRDVAAVSDHAAGAGLPVNPHGARMGGGRGVDRAARRQDALQRGEPDPAGGHATLQGLLGRGSGERAVPHLCRHPFLGMR